MGIYVFRLVIKVCRASKSIFFLFLELCSVRLEIGVINYCKLNLYNTYLQDDANIIYTYYAPQIRYFDILIRRSSLWLQNIHHAWDMLIDETEDPHQFRMEGLSISFLKPDELVEQALQNNLR